jgi:hypothetical protein
MLNFIIYFLFFSYKVYFKFFSFGLAGACLASSVLLKYVKLFYDELAENDDAA